MRLLSRVWLVLLLVPALLVAGATNGAYALFECSMTGLSQPSCCCAGAREADGPVQDELSRPSCCEERTVQVEAPQADALAKLQLAVLAASFTRLAVRELFSYREARQAFTPREAPRAIGPPLILLYRVLRL